MQDLRFSARMLRKSPGFAAVAILTLALAIGANAVAFGLLNALILHPPNVPRAESLYAIEHGNEHSMAESYPDCLDLRDRNRSFDGLAAWTISQAGLDTAGNPSRVWLSLTTGNYFDVLGIQPYIGRFFHTADERGPNSAPYIILTYDYWRSRFFADGDVVGRTVRLNKHPFTILGVARLVSKALYQSFRLISSSRLSMKSRSRAQITSMTARALPSLCWKVI